MSDLTISGTQNPASEGAAPVLQEDQKPIVQEQQPAEQMPAAEHPEQFTIDSTSKLTPQAPDRPPMVPNYKLMTQQLDPERFKSYSPEEQATILSASKVALHREDPRDVMPEDWESTRVGFYKGESNEKIAEAMHRLIALRDPSQQKDAIKKAMELSDMEEAAVSDGKRAVALMKGWDPAIGGSVQNAPELNMPDVGASASREQNTFSEVLGSATNVRNARSKVDAAVERLPSLKIALAESRVENKEELSVAVAIASLDNLEGSDAYDILSSVGDQYPDQAQRIAAMRRIADVVSAYNPGFEAGNAKAIASMLWEMSKNQVYTSALQLSKRADKAAGWTDPDYVYGQFNNYKVGEDGLPVHKNGSPVFNADGYAIDEKGNSLRPIDKDYASASGNSFSPARNSDLTDRDLFLSGRERVNDYYAKRLTREVITSKVLPTGDYWTDNFRAAAANTLFFGGQALALRALGPIGGMVSGALLMSGPGYGETFNQIFDAGGNINKADDIAFPVSMVYGISEVFEAKYLLGFGSSAQNGLRLAVAAGLRKAAPYLAKEWIKLTGKEYGQEYFQNSLVGVARNAAIDYADATGASREEILVDTLETMREASGMLWMAMVPGGVASVAKVSLSQSVLYDKNGEVRKGINPLTAMKINAARGEMAWAPISQSLVKKAAAAPDTESRKIILSDGGYTGDIDSAVQQIEHALAVYGNARLASKAAAMQIDESEYALEKARREGGATVAEKLEKDSKAPSNLGKKPDVQDIDTIHSRLESMGAALSKLTGGIKVVLFKTADQAVNSGMMTEEDVLAGVNGKITKDKDGNQAVVVVSSLSPSVDEALRSMKEELMGHAKVDKTFGESRDTELAKLFRSVGSVAVQKFLGEKYARYVEMYGKGTPEQLQARLMDEALSVLISENVSGETADTFSVSKKSFLTSLAQWAQDGLGITSQTDAAQREIMSFMRFMANDVVKEASGEKPAAEQTEQKPEGRASLTTVHHWGAPGLTEVDPNFHGTGSRYGAEQKRRQNSPARYLPRIYFGGDRYAESPEFDDAKPRYAAQIDTAKFLDLSQGGPELDAMIAKAKELAGDHPLTSGIGMDAFTELENLVKDAGYQGLYNAQQDVYISFDKQAVTPVNGDVRASLAQTKTPEFKKWFGDSKVVDADGKPLVVYHGTVSDFTEFKKARNDIGMHFGTPEQANHRVLAPGYDPLINVMPVFLSIKNPLRVPDAANWDDARNFIDVLQDGIDVGTIDGKDVEAVKRMQAQIRTWIDEPTSRRNQSDYIRKAIQDEGYDGVVYKNEYEGSTDTEDSYIAFDPTQIKSATGNTGAFDGENPDIRYSVVPDSEAPNKTEIAYKLFRTKKSAPGQLFPLFIGAKTPTPIGQWVKAEYLPTPGFSPRPGWHVGVAPQASHLMKKDGTLPNDRVWAEVEIPADVDWQPIADQQPTKDIRGEVPVGGSYRFKRPANQGGEWRIAGALKVNRILTPEDVAKINGDRRFSIVPDALGFYSPAESAVDGLRQELFSVEQLRGVLQKLPGVKQEELEDNGFYEWLEGFGDGKVTKSQATEFLRNGGPKLKEVVYGNSKETYMPLWASAEMRELAAEHEEGGGTITARFWKTEAIHQNNVAAQLQARIDEDGDASPSFMRETRQEAIADARAREEQAVALYRSTRWHFATQQLFEQGLYNEEELGEMSPDGAVKTALSEVDGLTPEMLDDMSTSSVNSTVHETYQMDGVKTGYKETLIEMPATETSSEGNRAEVYDENGEYWGRVTRGDPRYDLAVSRGYKIVFDKKTNDASFKTGHWPNEKNVIVHLRNNIRTWIGGLKSYHIEEIQSDWHQKGRNTGYAGKSKKASSAEFVKDEGWIIRDANGVRMMSVGMDRNRPPEDAVAYAQKLIDGGAPAYLSAVPDAPFKKSHVMLAFKVALRDAVKAGAKYITWTTAKTQALRYANSMRGVANNLGWIAKKDGSGKIVSIDMIDGKNVSMDVSSDGVIESAPATDWIGNPLASVIGKSMAEKVLTEESGEIAGEDFTVDAEHFNLLYDSKGSSSGLPKWVSAYVKKWGVKPELTPISEQEEKTYEQFYRWAEEVAPLSKIKEAWNRYNKSKGGGNASPKFNHMTEELWRINDPIVEAFRAQTTGDKVWAVQITTEMAADVEAGQPRYSIVGKAAQTVGFYELAEDMESKGGDPMQIWKVTGWWRGPDNKWRFELFDTFELDLEWLGDRPTGEIETTVGAVVKNEKLFKAYPQMRDIKLVLTKTSGLNEQGLFDDGTNKYDSEVSKESKAWEIRIMFNSAFSATEMMRHEFQHAIQRIEDFARGGNPSMAVLIMRGYKTIKQYKEANDAIRKQIREIKENGSGSMASEAKKLDLEAKLREMELMDGKLANRYYKSLAGEVESRLVELRAEMSNQERMGQPPWETMRIMMETEKLLDDSGEVKNALIMPPVDFNRASIVSGVGDTVENLRRKLAKRKGTGVGINPAKRFDVDGKPLWIGADKRQGGKPFDGWVEESEQWLSPEEIKTFSEWYDNLYESFSAEFGKDADRWMVAWLAGQQNESPAGAMRNAFRVNDRINMILHGMRGGLTDANLEEILQGRSPQGGLGAKLADFYDSGHGRDTRTYMGDKAEGGQPFVADVHTGRDSGHIDQQTLTRIKAYADSGRLFYRGHKVSAIVTKTKTVTVGGRDVVQPEEIKLSYRGGTTLVKRDMSGSPSNSEYEGISEWGNALSDHLNKIAWQGRSDWKPRQAQAVGWMRTLRQYGLPESDLESSLSQNTYRISAEVAYDQSATLKQRFPEFKNLDLNAARSITQDVLEKMIPRVVSLVAPSAILRGVRYGSGYWDGAANPSMQFWVMGSEEAALIAEVSLAYLSQQAGTARVVIGKGGKNSRAVIFNSIGMETDLLAERLSSWLGEQTDKDAKAIMGFSAQATPDNSGIITFGLTAASADSVIRTLDRFEKETGIVVDWESVPAVPYFHGNDWTKNPNGETYKEAFVGSGGREEVWSQLNDLSGEYENSVREAFSKYASQELDAFYGEKQAAEQPSSETTDPTEEVRSSLAQRSDPNREVIVDMVIRRHRGDTINNATAAEIIKMYGATIKPFHAVMRSASIYRITEPLKDRFAAESPDMIRAIRDAEIDDAHMQVVAGAAQKAYAGGAVDMVGVNEAAAKDAADTAARGAAVARTVTEDPTIKLSSLIGELEIEEERREPPKRKVKEQPEDGAGEDEKPKAITESDLDADVPLENQGSIDSYLAKIKASIREKITAESDFMEAYRQAAGRLLRQAAKTLHFGVGRESLMRAANQIEGLSSEDAVDRRLATALNAAFQYRVKGTVDMKVAELLKKLKRVPKVGSTTSLASKDKINKEKAAYLRKVKAAVKMSTTAVEARLTELDNEIESKNGYESGTTASSDAVQHELALVADREIIERFGALKYKPLADVIEIVDSTLKFIDEQMASQAEMAGKLQEQTDERARAIMNAIKGGASKIKIGSFKAGFQQVLRYPMSLKQRLEILVSFASEDQRKNLWNDKGGTWSLKAWARQLDTASQKIRAMDRKDYMEMIGMVRAAYGLDSEVKAVRKIAELRRENKAYRQFSRQINQRNLSKSNLIQLLAYLEQTDSYEKNIELHGRADDRVAIRAVLDAGDLRMIDLLRANYSADRDVLSSQKRSITGSGFLSPDPFYMPVKMDRPAPLHEMAAALKTTPSTLTERRAHSRDVNEEADIFDLYFSRKHENAVYLAMGDLRIEMLSVFSRSDVGSVIEQTMGKKYWKQLKEHLFDSMSQKPLGSDASEAERLLMSYGGLALNFSVGPAIKQVASYPAFAFNIGLKNYMKHQIHVLTTESGRRFTDAMINSEWAKARFSSGGSYELARAFEKETAGPITYFFKKYGMAMNKGMDFLVVATGGAAVMESYYELLTSQGMDDAAAMKLALEWAWSEIEEGQQSSFAQQQAQWQRRGGTPAKAMGMFSSTTQQYLGKQNAALEMAINTGTKEAWHKFARIVILNHILMPTIFWFIGNLFQAMKGRPPDDDELEQWLMFCLVGPLSGWFVGRTFIQAGLDAFMRGRPSVFGGQTDLVPAEGMVRIIGELGASMGSLMQGDTYGAQKYFFDAVEDMLPPVRDLRTIYENYLE